MPPKRAATSRGGGATASDKKKSKKTTQTIIFKSGSKADELVSLNRLHKGKRVLLRAGDLYNNAIPPGEEHHLFQYSVKKVYAGGDGKNLASLDFENIAILDGGDEWINFVDVHSQNDDVDPIITDYSMDMLPDDHKRYNVHLGKVNQKKNDLVDAENEEKKAARDNNQNDVQAIFTRYSEDTSATQPKQKLYNILKGEFESDGPLQDHIYQAS